ncbi:MAG: hypothetical protein JW889_12410 [Verrucomicrobia bacterium]|nr:hypothetical protein [Verrucomicrobiota bacterium]
MRTAGWVVALLITAVALAALLASAPARADEATFTVIIVKATNDGVSIDPALNPYKSLLEDRGYTSFTKIGTTSFPLKEKQTKKFNIAGNVSAEIEYENEVNNRVAFKCRVFEGAKKALEVGYGIPRGGKTMVIFRGKVAYMLIIQAR